MIGIVQAVRDRLDSSCINSGRLNKKGCKVPLSGIPSPHVVVDFDESGSPLGPNEPRCDYLLVAEVKDERYGWVAPLELKSGRLHAAQVVRQLQAGASAAEKLVPAAVQIRFRPVAVGSVPKAERNRLRRKGRILFRGRMEAVRWMSCGAPLAKTLNR